VSLDLEVNSWRFVQQVLVYVTSLISERHGKGKPFEKILFIFIITYGVSDFERQ